MVLTTFFRVRLLLSIKTSTPEARSVIQEAKKLDLVFFHDPSGRKNRCFYQCLAFFLGLDVHEVIRKLEDFMIKNQFLAIKNEVILFNMIQS